MIDIFYSLYAILTKRLLIYITRYEIIFLFIFLRDMHHKPTVIFILGGPGSGKGTQC